MPQKLYEHHRGRQEENEPGRKGFQGVSTNSAQVESDLNLPLLTNAASVSYSPKSFQYVRIKSCSIGYVLHGRRRSYCRRNSSILHIIDMVGRKPGRKGFEWTLYQIQHELNSILNSSLGIERKLLVLSCRLIPPNSRP